MYRVNKECIVKNPASKWMRDFFIPNIKMSYRPSDKRVECISNAARQNKHPSSLAPSDEGAVCEADWGRDGESMSLLKLAVPNVIPTER